MLCHQCDATPELVEWIRRRLNSDRRQVCIQKTSASTRTGTSLCKVAWSFRVARPKKLLRILSGIYLARTTLGVSCAHSDISTSRLRRRAVQPKNAIDACLTSNFTPELCLACSSKSHGAFEVAVVPLATRAIPLNFELTGTQLVNIRYRVTILSIALSPFANLYHMFWRLMA